MIQVTVHPSQFPDRVKDDLLDSLRTRRVKHKFHYDSYKQAQKWLAVHEAHSPAIQDRSCVGTYERAFSSLADNFENSSVHVIGLGCGGGHKDAALLERLKLRRNSLFYTAVDVSLALVIAARKRVETLVSGTDGIVCDLEAADELGDTLSEDSTARRIITFFGMIPNSAPEVILPKLRKLLAPGDVLFISANLAPGEDYTAGVKRVLPQYDNALTADWLLTFLDDLGIERNDGQLKFSIQETAVGLLRVRADFVFDRARTVTVEAKEFSFEPKESLRLFYSYRYTPKVLKRVLEQHGLRIIQEWLVPSGEEGVFQVMD